MATVLNPNASEDEPLRINLEDDAAPAVGEAAAKPAAAASAETPAVAPAVGIDDLKRQLEATARNRQQWQEHARQQQQRADQAAAIAAQAQERGILAEEVVNETRLNAVNEQMESLTEAQKGAYESGDWGKVADINTKLGKLGGQVAVLEQQQQWLATQRQQHVAQQQYNQQRAAAQPAAPTDPVERAIASRTPRTQAFLRQHPELMRSDGSFTRAAVEAHERAMDEKLRVDTDDYFRRVEEILGSGGGGETRQRQVKDTPARPKGAPTTAAPVSRGGNVPGQISGSEFVMTPHMRELAEEQGVEPAEWAAQYVRLIREGRIEPIE